jgi:coenzyme F420-reducing hydrogenase beta subunit
MKSARFIESFAWQMKVPLREVKQFDFRHKIPDRPANWYNAMLLLNNGDFINKDWWHMADGDWGAGFFMNSACNFCDDVVAETADISFGDAWVQPYASDGKGTNVIVVRSPVMNSLISEGISEGRLKLEEVPAGFVHQTQAAGFRQRREGLAYRLRWLRKGVKPPKRVAPEEKNIPKERKIIYQMRYSISKWSHRMFLAARLTGMHFIYLLWARCVTAIYYGIAYKKGSIADMKKRFFQLCR